MNIKTWKNYKQLSDLTNFLIALRREDKPEMLNENFPFDYELIHGEKLDLSSSAIRKELEEMEFLEKLGTFEEDIDLPDEIIGYITENDLYPEN